MTAIECIECSECALWPFTDRSFFPKLQLFPQDINQVANAVRSCKHSFQFTHSAPNFLVLHILPRFHLVHRSTIMPNWLMYVGFIHTISLVVHHRAALFGTAPPGFDSECNITYISKLHCKVKYTLQTSRYIYIQGVAVFFSTAPVKKPRRICPAKIRPNHQISRSSALLVNNPPRTNS